MRIPRLFLTSHILLLLLATTSPTSANPEVKYHRAKKLILRKSLLQGNSKVFQSIRYRKRLRGVLGTQKKETPQEGAAREKAEQEVLNKQLQKQQQ